MAVMYGHPSAASAIERDYLLGVLDGLQEVHIILLGLLRNQHAFCDLHGLVPTHGNRSYYFEGKLEHTLAKYLAPISASPGLTGDKPGALGPIWKNAFRDLQNLELVGRETGMGESHAANLTVFFTAFGMQFADFIALPTPNGGTPSENPAALE